MDAYAVYLNTFRYVMNADAELKSSWKDIFKYLPCLRKLLSCVVCDKLLKNPHSSPTGICLHNVCYKCLGGKVARPACNSCKDQSSFKENKKMQVLILCYKRLCVYVNHSALGLAVHSSVNGHDRKEVERTLNALKEAEDYVNEYKLTPPPIEPQSVLRNHIKEHKYHFAEYKPSPSTSGLMARSLKRSEIAAGENEVNKEKKSKILKRSPKANTSAHVKRIKKKALDTSRRKKSGKTKIRINLVKKAPCKTFSPAPKSFLISQRPHRDLSGKASVGQLWRETFLEERSSEPEVYPDSGIEVGNLSDQDAGSHSPNSTAVKDLLTSTSIVVNNDQVFQPLRDTRSHPLPEFIDTISNGLNNDNNNNMVPGCDNLPLRKKSRLTLTIPKKRLQVRKVLSRRGLHQRPCVPRKSISLAKIPESEVLKSTEEELSLSSPTNVKRMKLRGSVDSVNNENDAAKLNSKTKLKKDACKCARFKRPSRLTCFGQKCPCYRDKKACVDCLCNGCKNPRRRTTDLMGAPPLMHVSKNMKVPPCLSPDVDLSMPRLSPVPKM